MQFSTLVLSALSVASAAVAQTGMTTVHVVTVSSRNNSLTFSPNNMKAKVGDMVQFQFMAGNHTVTQSTFAAPCAPIGMSNASTPGFYSGFMPVAAGATSAPTYTVMVNSTTPIWVYCSQGKHCQAGMTMVINENTASGNTLAKYTAAAKQATQNLPGSMIMGGISSTNSTNGPSSPTNADGSTKATNASGASKLSSMGAASLVIAAFVAML